MPDAMSWRRTTSVDATADNIEIAQGREGSGPEHVGRVPLPAEVAEPLRQLEERRAELRAQVWSIDQDEDQETARPRFSNHLAEDAQDQQQRQSAAAMRQVMLQDLWQVEHALERAVSGNYGLCEDCSREIPPRRLQAMPAATLCVQCQGRREMKQAVQ
jgi:RNA polymerase-binding transcription factor DksA